MEKLHERGLYMELTETQKLLFRGLRLFPISEENQEAIFLFLFKSKEKMWEMMDFLVENREAKELQIMEKLENILTRK